MNRNYRMSHNACSVELKGGTKVFIRLLLLKNKSPEWFFNVTSEDGVHCFTSMTYSSSTVAINGIINFIILVDGLFFSGTPSSVFDKLVDLFSDVVFTQEVV